MRNLSKKYVVSESGQKVGVVFDMQEYKRILDALEELDSLRAYDEAKTSGEKPVPFDKAARRLEKRRRA